MREFGGNPDLTARFKLTRHDDTLVLHGQDDAHDPFKLTLDQLWAYQLMQEIEDWLANG